MRDTNLTTGAQMLAETLERDYGVDPAPAFAAAGLDMSRLTVPGARYPWSQLVTLWNVATELSGDPGFGLKVGARGRVSAFHAIGHSWIASATLLEALERLCRYRRVLSNLAIDVQLVREEPDAWCLSVSFPPEIEAPPPSNEDAFLRGLLGLIRAATNAEFMPQQVRLSHGDLGIADRYVEAFGDCVKFNQPDIAMAIARADAEAPLPGNNPELANANDQVAERYLASLEPDRIASEVREILVEIMPSGTVRQDDVAKRMNRSLSTLQRQLSAEGISFQQLRDETRRQLAEDYIRTRRLSLSQIAYLLGFSDQSNFSRAFKRWTGMSPREYRGNA